MGKTSLGGIFAPGSDLIVLKMIESTLTVEFKVFDSGAIGKWRLSSVLERV